MPPTTLYTVLHASAYPVKREGVAAMLQKTPGFTGLGHPVEHGDWALLTLFRHRPHIALLDYALPGANGLQVAECLAQNQSPTRVALCVEDDEAAALSAVALKNLRVSVLCYRHADAQALRACLKALRDGGRYVSPQFEALRQTRPPKAMRERFAHAALDRLSDRERLVVKLIAGGHTSHEIARQMCISNRTVDAHRGKICKKLNLKGPNALVHYAYEHKAAWRHG